jgi:hypothetical protein
MGILVGKDTPINEPMWFYAPFFKKPDYNNNIFYEVTEANIYIKTDSELSETGYFINEINNINIIKGKKHYIELTFENGVNGKMKDFRPILHVLFYW